MKMPKRIAAVALCLAVFFLGAKLAGSRCGDLATMFPAVGYDAWAFWFIPAIFPAFLYYPAYDLLSFASYQLGYEPTFDEARVYPEDSIVPASRRQKLLGYPFLLAIMSAFLAAWAKMVYCG
jgi:hypothetical protein